MVTSSISRDGGGVSESVRLLANALKEQTNSTIQIVTLLDAHFDQDIKNWKGFDIKVFRYWGPSNFGFSPGLLFYMLRMRADLVHVHGIWTFHCFAVLLWSIFHNGPYVVSPHGMLESWILKRSVRLKRIVSFLYQSKFLHRASAFHILTEKERLDVTALVPEARCVLVPNFVPVIPVVKGKPNWFHPEISGRKIYLFFGRIHEKKGWQELCDAWCQTCDLNPEFLKGSQLVFCGWVDGSSNFVDHIEEINRVYGNIMFAGPQFGQDKTLSLQAADNFILPSKSEGLPMVILEAWACGKPVLMTKACNLKIGFDKGAALEIGETVDKIAKGLDISNGWSKEYRQAMAEAGYNLVKDKFSASAVARGMVSLYELSKLAQSGK